jgi:carbon-monoxide dehydrogenase large subunit
VSILGNRVARREDPALLTGHGTYVDNLALEHAACVTYVRSTLAHGRITGIAVDEARSFPGVLGVFTAADLDLPDLVPFGAPSHPMSRPVLARDTVRFVGEPIVAVVTESPAIAEDAAELVWIDYEPLDAVIDAEESLRGETLLFPEADNNVCMRFEPRDRVADFSDAEVIVRHRFVNQRVAACPIETRTAAAWWEDDRLVAYVSCQGGHPIRDEFARFYGLEHDQVRVVVPDVGGGFGAKAAIYPEQLVLAELARRVGRPVRWSETRTENMQAMNHGRGQIQEIEIGGRRDGTITAYRLTVVQDAGAYPMIGAVLPFMTRMMVTGTYAIPSAEFSSHSVCTNATPVGAYRGAGRPEAAAAIERAVDLFAAEIGADPAEVRRTNLVSADAFPYTTAIGTVYDSGNYPEALDRALEAAGYDELRAEQARRREADDPKLLGIGLSCYVEITALDAGGEYGSVELRGDGSVLAKTGSSPYGQGHHTTWAMLISERLGIPMDRIEVIHGDTDLVPSGSITGGSRSVQIAGSAINDAAGKLADVARDQAADLLEAAPDDVVLTEGRFHVAGTPAVSLGWDDIAATSTETLVGLSGFEASSPTFPFGAHVAVVEIDRDTGDVRLVRHIACDDAGRIINPLIVEGQVHGGLAQGIAQALYEEVRYDEDGNPLTSTFADYEVISATELPMFELVPMETPTPINPLGAKGIGESGTIGSTPAVQNAVVDAVSHLGVRHIDLPCTPERVWHAIS